MKYYIVNETDRPSEMLVAYDTGKGLRYLHPDLEGYNEMGKNRATPLEDFGLVTEELPGGILFWILRDSTAHYSNGDLRPWQGAKRFILPYPPPGQGG